MADAQRAEIAKLESLYAEHPEGRVFTHLAEAYRKAGELDRAREVLDEGIQRHPDYPSAHVVMGRVLRDQGEPRRAADEFRRVLELDSHNLVALRALGDLARTDGRQEEALDFYQRLLDVEPADETVRELVTEMTAAGETAPPPQEAPAWEQEYDEGLAAGTTDSPATDSEYGEEVPATPMEAPAGFESTLASEANEAGSPAGEAAPDEPRAAGGFDVPPESGFEEFDAPVESGATAHPDVAAEAAPAAGAEFEGEIEVPDELGGSAYDLPEEHGGAEPDPAEGLAMEESEFLAEAVSEESGEPDLAWADPEGEAGPDEEAAGEAPADDGRDLTTETIAGIYARQGLYDRAAEVYRQLLRSRPDDESLRAKLEEVEASAAAAGGEDEGAGPQHGTEGAESIEGLEATEFQPAASDVPPMEGLETDERDPEAGLVTSSFAAAESGPAHEAERSPEASDSLESTESGAEVAGDPDWPWEAGDSSWGAPAASESGELDRGRPEHQPEPEPEAVESVWTGADGAAAHDESPYAWTQSDTSPDESEPIGTYFRSLLGWSRGGGGEAGGEAGAAGTAPVPAVDVGPVTAEEPPTEETGTHDVASPDAAATEAEAPAAEPEREAEAEAEAEPAAETEPELEAGPAVGESREPGAEDDDDLDTFRSWLESLKQ